MRFKINVELMLENASALLKAVPTKTSNPILENFLIQMKKGLVRMTASDGEITIRSTIPTLEAIQEGSAAVPAKILTELLKTLPAGDAEFILNDNDTMTVSWDKGQSTLPVFDWKDFPAVPPVEKGIQKIKTTQSAMQDALSKTAYAASDEQDLKPALSGILLDITETGFNVVATDSHKLIVYNIDGVPATQPTKVILPKRSALMMKGLLRKDGEVDIICNDATVRFQFGNTEFITRSISAKYPNYEQVIPKANSNVLTIGRTELLSAVKRIAVCSDRASMLLKIELKYNEIKLSAQDLAYSVAANEKAVCEYDGEDIQIGFKAPMFIDILGSLDCTNIDLHFKNSKSAMLIVPTREEDKPANVRAILMPQVIK